MSCVKAPESEQPDTGLDGLDYNASAVMQPRAPTPTPKELRNGKRVKTNAVQPKGV